MGLASPAFDSISLIGSRVSSKKLLHGAGAWLQTFPRLDMKGCTLRHLQHVSPIEPLHCWYTDSEASMSLFFWSETSSTSH